MEKSCGLGMKEGTNRKATLKDRQEGQVLAKDHNEREREREREREKVFGGNISSTE